MMKLIRSSALLLSVFAAVVAGYLWLTRVSAVERFLSHQLGTVVSVSSVDVSLGGLSIKGVRIDNPSLGKLPTLFEAKEIVIHGSPLALYLRPRHIKSVRIIDSTLGLELFNPSGSENTWSHLLKSLPHQKATPIRIDHVAFINTRFRIYRLNGKHLYPAPIPLLECNTSYPLALPDLSRSLVEKLLRPLSSHSHLTHVLDRIAPPRVVHTDSTPLSDTFTTLKQKTAQAADFLLSLFS